MALELILIDTCIWAEFFSKSKSSRKQATSELIRRDRAAMIGPVLAEILMGLRRDEHADWVASSLEGLHFFELTWSDWREAARLHRELAVLGHQLPLTDVTLAHVAMRNDCAVYTTDPHFDVISDLKRYSP